jgi:hypothetical protein
MTMQPLTPRTSAPIRTTDGAHHAQVGVVPVPEIDARLRAYAFALPHIHKRETLVSVGGAEALWIDEAVDLARPDLIHERELGHVHPDGSLHVTLSAERADEAVAMGWGELPPTGHKARHEGRILLFTPTNGEELTVVCTLIEESFAVVTGRPAGPASTAP